jgi:hypothetical protein
MKNYTLILVAESASALTSCTKEPSASYSSSANAVTVGEVVSFTDKSTDGFNHVWDFGDEGWSQTLNSTHVYDRPGTYSVTLQATDKKGVTTGVSSATAVTVSDDTYKGLIEASEEVKRKMHIKLKGLWNLKSVTYTYGGNVDFNPFFSTSGEFMADGNILQNDEDGNLSTGSYSVINETYIYTFLREHLGFIE